MVKLLRSIAGTIAVAGLLAGAACSTGGGASPTAAKPSATAAVPAVTKQAESASQGAQPEGTPAAKPATSPIASPAAASGGSTDWKATWDSMVAAAKKEGKLVIGGAPGDPYRKAAMAFQETYPEIQLDYIGVQGGDFAPRIIAERDGGQYLWDLHAGGWNTPLIMLKPKGVLDPFKSAVILPEAVDEKNWLGGFEDGWVDNERTLEYAFQGSLIYLGYVNRDIAPESELSSVDQLLDPKWKGKIVSQDPRITGPFSSFMGYLLSVKGEDFVRKLMSQDLALIKSGRDQVEALVRGSYAVGLGIMAADMESFKREGLADKLLPIDPENPAGRRLSSAFGNIMLVNKAPHPNAAKLYINWLLSKAGQKAYVEVTGLNSRRLDVAGPAEMAPNPNAKYEVNEREWSPLVPNTVKAMNMAKEIFK